MVPIFQGLGYIMIYGRFLGNNYYMVVSAWAFFYLFASFTAKELPWATCTGEWNTRDCYTKDYDDKCSAEEVREILTKFHFLLSLCTTFLVLSNCIRLICFLKHLAKVKNQSNSCNNSFLRVNFYFIEGLLEL